MKVQMNIALTAAVLLAFVAVFAGEALARPDWVSCSYVPSLVVTGKDIQKADYYSVKIVVNYTNNNKQGLVITKIFDKTLTFSAQVTNKTRFSMNKTSVKGAIKSPKVNDCEIYPGQTYSLTYYVPISSFGLRAYFPDIRSLREVNEDIRKIGVKNYFPNRKYSHDFQVRTY